MKEYKKISITGSENFFFLSDGVNIIYCQKLPHSDGYEISSVHKPNEKIGTGFRLHDYATLDTKTIDNALQVFIPNWADRSDMEKVTKYSNLDEFINYEKQFFGDKVTVENITI